MFGSPHASLPSTSSLIFLVNSLFCVGSSFIYPLYLHLPSHACMFRFWTVRWNLKGICFQSPFLFEYTILSSNRWLRDWPLQRQELPGSCWEEGWIELGRTDICKLKQPLFCQHFIGVHKAHREKLITLVTLNFLNVTRGKGSHLVCFWFPY